MQIVRRTFLALGDSYTIGEGVAEAERWPVQLARALGIDPPEILACTGWTTDELAAAMAVHTFHPPYDLVTLLIGVNNQYRGRSLANYRDELRALLDRAITLAGDRAGRVVVVSIPDWGVTRFGHASGRDVVQIAREIDAFNAANCALARSRRAHYLDVTALSREHAGDVVGDGLHPNAEAYTQWAQAMTALARQALAPR